MGILALVLIWPLLFLVLGMVFVSAADVSGLWIVFPTIILLLIFLFGIGGRLSDVVRGDTKEEDLDRTRRSMVAFSIALLLPVFVRYFLEMAGKDLMPMIAGLIFGFGIFLWGLFMKKNRVLIYANVVGGAFVIVYLYFQLWSLGQLAQVIASAFGLVMAVAVSIVKFRDKLA